MMAASLSKAVKLPEQAGRRRVFPTALFQYPVFQILRLSLQCEIVTARIIVENPTKNSKKG
jgi:hypothetical protein